MTLKDLKIGDEFKFHELTVAHTVISPDLGLYTNISCGPNVRYSSPETPVIKINEEQNS